MGAARKSATGTTSRFQEVLLKLSLAMVGTSVLVCSVVGGIIHLYATFLAFELSGFGAAFLTFATPFFAELYWIAITWLETGVFWNGLTIASIAYFVLCGLTIIAGIAAASNPD
jgi:hypothetical protein